MRQQRKAFDISRRQFARSAAALGLVVAGGGGIASLRASDDNGPSTHKWSLEHGGLTRTFRVHLPPAYPSKRGMALVLALHGGGGSSRSTGRLTGFDPIADKSNFIVAYPDAVGRLWNDGVKRNDEDNRNIDDVGFFSALIDELVKRCGVDASRVYVAGISNGGHMSNRLAIELSDRIAAIGPVGATVDAAYAAVHKPSRPVSVIYFHGDADPLRYYNGGGKPGGNTLSARAMTDWWVAANGCVKTPDVQNLPDVADDGMTVKREIYRGGRENAEVALYTIAGGGHTWPGGWQYYPEWIIGKTSRDINASELMWEFFSKHRR